MEDELSALSKEILSLLVFEESFEHILSEVKIQNNYAVADELKTLIVKDFVRPCRDIESKKNSGIMYDSDKMKDYSFTLTAKGLTYLEKNFKHT